MYGTCETLCRELEAKYPGDTPLMLVIWSPQNVKTAAPETQQMMGAENQREEKAG